LLEQNNKETVLEAIMKFREQMRMRIIYDGTVKKNLLGTPTALLIVLLGFHVYFAPENWKVTLSRSQNFTAKIVTSNIWTHI